MKRLIILSDSHGNAKGIADLMPLIAENDYVIHLGDGAVDMRETRSLYPDKVYACGGNCDFFSQLPEDGILEVENVRIYFCHGHKYGVKNHLYALALAAKERDCSIALYGHTHVAGITEVDGVTLINPGSLRYAVGKGGSYCYLVIHKDKATPTIVGEQYF
jgi:putative phosphoesterase